MNNNIFDMSKEELLAIENFGSNVEFDGFVIVPTSGIHESLFGCMKFILLDKGMNIVGSVGGCSDVIYFNGIGGYGEYDDDYSTRVRTGLVPAVGYRIDCLPKSGCLRVFANGFKFKTDDFCGSDFCFYAVKKRNADIDWE